MSTIEVIDTSIADQNDARFSGMRFLGEQLVKGLKGTSGTEKSRRNGVLAALNKVIGDAKYEVKFRTKTSGKSGTIVDKGTRVGNRFIKLKVKNSGGTEIATVKLKVSPDTNGNQEFCMTINTPLRAGDEGMWSYLNETLKDLDLFGTPTENKKNQRYLISRLTFSRCR